MIQVPARPQFTRTGYYSQRYTPAPSIPSPVTPVIGVFQWTLIAFSEKKCNFLCIVYQALGPSGLTFLPKPSHFLPRNTELLLPPPFSFLTGPCPSYGFSFPSQCLCVCLIPRLECLSLQLFLDRLLSEVRLQCHLFREASLTAPPHVYDRVGQGCVCSYPGASGTSPHGQNNCLCLGYLLYEPLSQILPSIKVEGRFSFSRVAFWAPKHHWEEYDLERLVFRILLSGGALDRTEYEKWFGKLPGLEDETHKGMALGTRDLT